MALTGIWYIIGFAFAAGSFTFLTFGAAWLLFNILSSIIHAILWAIPGIGHLFAGLWALLSALVQIAFLIVLIVAIVKAFSGVRWDIPWVGPMARQQTREV